MFLLNLIVFTNLFLIPIFFHPVSICRHLIHLGHEPFHPESLHIHSYESYLYRMINPPKSYINISPIIKSENIFQRLMNYLLNKNMKSSRKVFYPNLIIYTWMYIYKRGLSPFIQSFLFMYISYFVLTYFSSLVHVYRISIKTKRVSVNDIRYHVRKLMESSYIRWIFDALYWKFIGVFASHIFYVLAVRILMQTLSMSSEHFHRKQNLIYSSWNLKQNIQLIYQTEGWIAFFSGILPRLIYELGKQYTKLQPLSIYLLWAIARYYIS